MSHDSYVEFSFRCFVIDGDGIQDIEFWIHELEPMDRKSYPLDWVREHVGDFWDEEWLRESCGLSKDGSFQILGKAKLHGWKDSYPSEEWGEEADILEYETAPVPDGWWEWKEHGELTLDDNGGES
jgi:hypothetical protein